MEHTTFNFSSNDGLNLFGRVWHSASAHPKGVVNLVHGLGEHSGRYAHIAEALTKAGYHLAAFDLRGHGLSEGKRGHSPSFDLILDDVSLFLEQSQSLLGANLPSFLYGHSLGGVIVIDYGLRRSSDLSGVISTDPALALSIETPKIQLLMAKAIRSVAPATLISNGLDVNALSRDAAIVKAYQDDVLVHDRISVQLVLDMIAAGQYGITHAAEWDLPLLLMHGTADRITSAEASKSFAEQAGDKVTLALWEDYYHEVHNDTGKAQVIETMISWLDAQLS